MSIKYLKKNDLLSTLLLHSILIYFVCSQKYGPYDFLSLKTFWKGTGVAIPYPGHITLTSDKLTYQRGILTTMDSYDWSEFFSLSTSIRFDIQNYESNQAVFFYFSEVQPKLNLYKGDFNIQSLGEAVNGLVIYIKDFDTLHVGFFDHPNLTESQILSQAKICKISARNKGKVDLNISLKLGTLGVYFLDGKDATFRICAQYPDVKFNNPQYFSVSGADNVGKSHITICTFFI
jgi:hypothetical protein